MRVRITFIGGAGNISTTGDWITSEGQRLELPLRVPVEVDLSAVPDADRNFYDTIMRKMRRMPAFYTVEDLDPDGPEQPAKAEVARTNYSVGAEISRLTQAAPVRTRVKTAGDEPPTRAETRSKAKAMRAIVDG